MQRSKGICWLQLAIYSTKKQDIQLVNFFHFWTCGILACFRACRVVNVNHAKQEREMGMGTVKQRIKDISTVE